MKKTVKKLQNGKRVPGVALTHLGAEHCVTGSCHLLETDDGIVILVDCGKALGHDPEISFDDFPVSPASIDYLIITHTHIDHIGRVPDLIDAGFCGEILCTHGTKALMQPMLHDAMGFSKRSRQRIKALERRIDELSWGFDYNETFSLKTGITVKLGNAGHILGSCFVTLGFPGDGSSGYTIVFSGDLGCSDTPILPDPDVPGYCDLLVMESTYGDRDHQDRSERVKNLEAILAKALEDDGIVYIPAFALGRTQELIYELDRIKVQVPVFIDSPLGIRITKLYSVMEEYWDKEAKALMAGGDHPMDFKNLYAVERFGEHKKLMGIEGPAIIIAGSGMCTGGRIVDHLKKGLDDPKNDILFVGYQARGTAGRKLINKKKAVKAGVYTLSGYSAHADQRTLVSWVEAMEAPPGMIKLVHGEPGSQKALKQLFIKKGLSLAD